METSGRSIIVVWFPKSIFRYAAGSRGQSYASVQDEHEQVRRQQAFSSHARSLEPNSVPNARPCIEICCRCEARKGCMSGERFLSYTRQASMLSISTSFVLTLLYTSSALAAPTVTTRAFNVDAPAPTPSHVAPKPPTYLPLSTFDNLFTVVETPTTAVNTTSTTLNATSSILNSTVDATNSTADDVADDMTSGANVDVAAVSGDIARRSAGILSGLFARGRSVRKVKTQKQKQQAIQAMCVDSSANDTYISSLFYYGGAGTTVFLCPGAVISITNAVFFSAPDQTLATQGFPSGNKRATLRVAGADQSCAIYGAIDGANNVALRNIQVDGSRPSLGLITGGLALIELGGNTQGQIVDSVHAYEPRGWSCLHAIEGANLSCSGMKITNNDIGPSGHGPSGAQQFRRDAGNYAPGQWADGISLACKNSLVQGNTITDATDGGIVIFQAPQSIVQGNTIIAVDRQLLGGINMVDYWPFGGAYTGVKVQQNTIISQSSMIKLGIALGGMTWGVDNRTIARTSGGTVQNNVFASGNKGYFGYAIGIAGHENATVTGNSANAANFGGVESSSCFTAYLTLPTPQPYIADAYTTPGCKLQKGFSLARLVLLICRGPGAIIRRGGWV